MRFFQIVSRNSGRFAALFALTLAAPVACGGGTPEVSKPDSEIIQAGKDGGGKAGSSTSNAGGASSAGGPVIVIPEGGACAEGCAEDKVVCGDGVLQAIGEECDDKNTTPGDGCSATCTVEEGYLCPVPGAMCRAAACGDGMLAGLELCDDGNTDNGDGCTDTCTFEANYECATPGELCTKTNCGDGEVQGSEGCDDGNHYLGDGCGIDCEKEPKCAPPEPCTSECGDGMSGQQHQGSTDSRLSWSSRVSRRRTTKAWSLSTSISAGRLRLL